MRFVKWVFWILATPFLLGFLHYTLPQTDVVRIVGTENRRIDFGENSLFWASPDVGTAPGASRDVFFINAVYPDGDTMEYRNEDTGWGWPPYFKMDSSSVNTEAKEFTSTAAAPRWVAITHYGWRNELFTIFPNAVSIRPVDGPDASFFPWASIVILTTIALLLWMLRRMWLQFRERMIEPAVIEAQEAADDARGWFRRLFGRKPRV